METRVTGLDGKTTGEMNKLINWLLFLAVLAIAVGITVLTVWAAAD
jgi:hypothetical protein